MFQFKKPNRATYSSALGRNVDISPYMNRNFLKKPQFPSLIFFLFYMHFKCICTHIKRNIIKDVKKDFVFIINVF